MLLGRFIAVGQRAKRKGECLLRVVGDCAPVLIEVLGRVAHMLRGLIVKLRCRCVMRGRGRGACARSCRRGRDRRRAGGVRASVVCVIDSVQPVTVRHDRLVRGVVVVFTCLEMP